MNRQKSKLAIKRAWEIAKKDRKPNVVAYDNRLEMDVETLTIHPLDIEAKVARQNLPWNLRKHILNSKQRNKRNEWLRRRKLTNEIPMEQEYEKYGMLPS